MNRHFENLQELLALERQEEEARTRDALEDRSARQLQAEGLALTGLAVEESTYSGADERLEVTLRRADRQALPFHAFRIGARAAVGSRGSGEAETAMGTVTDVADTTLTIQLDKEPEDELLNGALNVILTADDVTLRRMEKALRRVAIAREGRLKELRQVIVLGERAPDWDRQRGDSTAWCDEGLDDSQRAAVRHALAAEHVALIHGPPGTGKTRTLAEVIRQAVARGDRVLATAPANIAVDNLLERVAAGGVDCVRLGHPARVRPHLREHAFDVRLEAALDPEVLKPLRQEERSLRAQLGRAKGGWRELRDELRRVRGDVRRLQRSARRQVIEKAAVVFATCTGAGHRMLEREDFDLVVLDEAAQCLEPLAYLPMERGHRLIMAGDHRQLPPTVLSTAAARGGLARSLFEDVMERGQGSQRDDDQGADRDHPGRMLTMQYRMHHDLMDFLSGQLYDGRLEAHPSVANHHLEGLPPLVFIDSAGAGHDEHRGDDADSYANPGEAGVLGTHLRDRLLAAPEAGGLGLAPTDIAVIAPYSRQVELLRRDLAQPGLEIDTVDGFQGREKEAVLVSLVRSNPDGEIGFLAEIRRMNVALSRARKHLWVIGDSATLARHPFYAAFLEHVDAVGGYDSVWSMV